MTIWRNYYYLTVSNGSTRLGRSVLVDYPELHLAPRILPLSYYSYYVSTIYSRFS